MKFPYMSKFASALCGGQSRRIGSGSSFSRRAAVLCLFGCTAAAAFQSPVEKAATRSALSTSSPLLDVAMAGKRLVAVGLRGHVVLSDDGGKTWVQADTPVSSDLVAVSFPSAQKGWAVGHGGVVIHTEDGGSTWTKQLDGERAGEIALMHYEKRLAEGATPELTRIRDQMKALKTEGSTQAFLDVHFVDDQQGFVVGTFNRIFRTQDGGRTWTPWMDRTGNARELHFYSIQGSGRRIVLTGEQGMVWEFDPVNMVFTPKSTGYNGTLFGAVIAGSSTVVFGMRGSVYRSADSGSTLWEKVQMPSLAGISGGTALDASQMVLANQAGVVLVSADAGRTFKGIKLSRPMSYFGISAAEGKKIALVGSNGVIVESLQIQ